MKKPDPLRESKATILNLFQIFQRTEKSPKKSPKKSENKSSPGVDFNL